MTRVIHTGDTHLGYRQYHRPERREDFLAAFRQVAEDAVADEVDAVVHAGDLFHDRRPNLGDIMGALSVLERLDEAGIDFLAVVGNHEAKRSGQWLDLFASLGMATRLGADPVRVGNTAFYGLDFVPRSGRDGFEPDFAGHDTDHAALVTHGLFEPFEFGEWDPRAITDPASVDFDAVLLGDNHHAETARLDDTWVTYCGSTERASAAEREERGYNLVQFDGEVDIRRRGLDTREFVYVDVELGPGEGADRVCERVGQHDVDDAVVVVTVTGDGEPVTPASVEEFALDRGALVARVTDHRDAPEEPDREVSFADPDDAVRERVRDLGLSRAARDIDETVRASKVPDSTVADEVEAHVADLVESGDAEAFAPVESTAEGSGESGNADAADGAESEGTAPGESDDGETPAGATSSSDTVADESSPDGTAADGTAATESEDETTGEAPDRTLEDFA